MANDVFSRVDGFLDKFLTTITTDIQKLLASDIGTVILVSITLYIVIYGYMVLAGKVQTPLSDLIWNLSRLAIIIAFVKNEGGMLDMFNEAVKGLSTIGGNGKSVLGLFDSLLETTSNFAEYTSNNADTGTGWFVKGLIWTGFALMALPVSLTFLLSKISLYFLLALSPIFFFMLMWGWLKDSFAQFATALLSNALALVCINVMVQSSIDFIKVQMNMDGNPYLVAFSFIVFGVTAGMAIKYMVSVVNSVMRVSVERAGPGIIDAYKGAKNAVLSPLSPTTNATQMAAQRAATSQVATQKELQQVAQNLNKFLNK